MAGKGHRHKKEKRRFAWMRNRKGQAHGTKIGSTLLARPSSAFMNPTMPTPRQMADYWGRGESEEAMLRRLDALWGSAPPAANGVAGHPCKSGRGENSRQ